MLLSQVTSNSFFLSFIKKLKYAKLTDNCVAARRPENKNKNRYRNVLPYDANRVKLAGSDDYMNASHVRLNLAGGRAYLSYLACQGPLPNTTHDFWRMVWEQKAQVIAMVTQEVEASKVKCHRYWPDTSMVVCEGCLEISKVKQRSLANVGVSWLSMRDTATGETHPVMHLNYTTWPDHGAPLNALPLLRYIRLVHLSENTSDPAPIVVHCSAGIGRTGAFITIDAALKMVQHDSKVDIQKIVQDLRRQRQGMIQTKDQYVFCYQALLQALQSLLPSA
ncbi:hypothetical protein CAPTEDRAFT_167635 [Capitella teleta]|uniref:Protein-tyrosine-phosphatase n=1 Tax=Capitella teleta TaxID=283909 RepID=R7T739_CAPTE|nr:hypothetical protein CAPTEDRAFT_167635 [Capitella teleta]|eukprot:ELT89390.1 hypothetical protein CAPTEDRAFT_167635 [Capitella teleta]